MSDERIEMLTTAQSMEQEEESSPAISSSPEDQSTIQCASVDVDGDDNNNDNNNETSDQSNDDTSTTKKKKQKRRWTAAQKREMRELKQSRKDCKKKRKPKKPLSPRSLRRRCVQTSLTTGSTVYRNPLLEDDTFQRIRTSCQLPNDSSTPNNDDDESAINTVFVQPLLVLDLNGILCHRVRREKEPKNSILRPSTLDVARTVVIPRPDLNQLLEFLDQHFCLAVWTSARAKTAKILLKNLMPPELRERLLFVWAQDRCRTVRDETTNDVIFVKNLKEVWKEYPLWGAHNTLLLDDSAEKCAEWSQNAVHPPPMNGQEEDQVLDGYPPDSVNAQHQYDFFQRLVQHWTQHPVVEEIDAEAGDSVYFQTATQVDFLRHHATGHMGW